jgi:hypothetical protein
MFLAPSLPQDIPHSYVSGYTDVMSRLTKRYNMLFAADFMDGVMNNPYAFDEDTRYPTGVGVRIMLDKTKPHVMAALDKIRRLRIDMKYQR